MDTVEIIGYLAPVFLVISFFFKNVKALRAVNTIGCLLFVVYGFCKDVYPVVVANVIIAVTNCYFLIKKK